jgi:hypothetical protein
MTPIQELNRGYLWLISGENWLLYHSDSLIRQIFLDLVRLQDTYGPTGPITHVVPYLYQPYKGRSEVYAYKTRKFNTYPLI